MKCSSANWVTPTEPTTIGFGAWAIGGPWDFGWGPQDDDESIATIRAGLDAGINWIDTAPAYGLGHSEEVVGQAIKGHRGGVILATKCGLVWNDPSERSVFNRLKAAERAPEAEGSLRRLGVDVIDLYQIHWPNPDADVEEAWTEIARMIEEGKIRYAARPTSASANSAAPRPSIPSLRCNRLTACWTRGSKPSCSVLRRNDIGVVVTARWRRAC